MVKLIAGLMLGLISFGAVYALYSNGKSKRRKLMLSEEAVNQLEDGAKAYKKGNYQQAYQLWLPLAEQGDPCAQYNLGVMHDKGTGVVQDFQKAFAWYKIAAEQGLAEAQNSLGVMYKNGEGVVQDDVKAHLWFNLAAANGLSVAKVSRDVVAKALTPDQIKQAQQLASACQAHHFSMK